MKKSNLIATLFLILTAVIWGLSYSEQAEAMNSMPPLLFVFLRYLLGTAVLLPGILYARKKPVKHLFTGGIACGVCLAGGEILQQYGLLYIKTWPFYWQFQLMRQLKLIKHTVML